MAKKAQRQPWMSSFVQTSVTKEVKAALQTALKENFDLENAISELVESGLKVTIRPGNGGKGSAVWLQPMDDNSPNAKMILVGHGSTVLAACCMAYVFHFHIFDGAWPEYNRSEETLFWDEVK